MRGLVTALTVVGMLGTGLIFTRPLLISDSPPWAGVDRVDDLKSLIETNTKVIEAELVATQIVPLQSRRCEAIAAKNYVLADAYDTQITERLNRYTALTGKAYRLSQCAR